MILNSTRILVEKIEKKFIIMKVIKNVIAMMLVVATFAFCGLGAYAAKTTHFNNAYGRAYTNSSASFNEIYCCVEKIRTSRHTIAVMLD